VSDIQMDWRGIESIKKLKDWGIEYSCSFGKMDESAPISFQGNNSIKSDFVKTENRLGFNVGRYDKNKVLVIDPTLVWGTYFGGEEEDRGYGIATDKAWNIYITGYTLSWTGIATDSVYQPQYGGYVGSNAAQGDAFLAKFDNSGKIKWATYFGGEFEEYGNSVATDESGNVYMTGYARSPNLATQGAYQTSGGGIYSDGYAFLAKFNDIGNMKWATYYGGNLDNIGTGVAVDNSGNVYITGYTYSTSGIATNGAYQTSIANGNTGILNAFLAKFNSGGALQWATYYGGSDDTYGYGVANDTFGNVYITGYTLSTGGIATSGAYQTSFAGGDYMTGDAFLAKFSSSGSIIWATYYGGSGEEEALGVATDGSGDAFITGYTDSKSNIATAGAFVTSYGPGLNNYRESFLAKFNGSGDILWATYYGGSSSDEGFAVATDSSANVYFLGWTESDSNIATKGAFHTSLVGLYDNFLVKFNSAGKRQWASYYGGGDEIGFGGIATDDSENVYITASASGDPGIATSGAHQTFYAGGGQDAYLVKFGFKHSYDAGISAILNPKNRICADSQTIIVQLHNYGLVQMDSVSIILSINSKIQSVYHWTGKLLPDSTITVNIGKYVFTDNHDSSSTIDSVHYGIGKDTIKSWTSYPNGVQDSVPANDTSISILKISPSPVGGMFPTQTICENDSSRIGGPGESGYNYSWTSNPAGFISTYTYPTVTPTVTTTYYEKITNALGCSNTASVVITVNPAPPAVAGPDHSICIGDSITIGDTASKAYSYKWASRPAGFSSNLPDPTVSPTSITMYDLTVTNPKTGCTNSSGVGIIVNPLPTPNPGQSSYNICTGSHVKIGANAKSYYIYSWSSNPAGFSSSLADPVVDPLNNTVYSLSVTDSLTGCTNKNSTNVFVRIALAPVVDVGKNQSICAGASAQIGSDSLPDDSYSWVSNPIGFISAKAKLIVTPLQTTSYSLTVTNSIGCTNFDSVTITVDPLPNSIAGKPQNICSGTVIRLGDSSMDGISYSWTSNPPGFYSNLSDPIDSPKITTDYKLKETITNTGCADSNNVLITVLPRPSVTFDVKNINGFKYQFTVQNPNYPSWQYHWNFGDTSSATSTGSATDDTISGYSESHTYTKNGKYNIILTVSLPGYCAETDSNQVLINEQFSLNIFPNPFELQTDINYTLVNSSHVKISLTDELGKQIGTLVDKQLNPGEYDTYVDAALLRTRPAMYFVLFQLDDKLIVKKIIQLEGSY